MRAEQKLAQLGLTLPSPPAVAGAYEPWVRAGNLIYTSGQLPWREGRIAYAGRLGAELDEPQGYEAARICGLNALAQLHAASGDLEKIRLIRLEGYVHAAPGFRAHPKVLNGASDLFNEVLGERGRHVRLALGISEMPFDAAVQLAVVAAIVVGG